MSQIREKHDQAPVGTDELRQALVQAQEDAARERARAIFLSAASEALSSSLDYEGTLAKVAQLAVPKIADWCVVELVGDSDGPFQRVAVAHVDPAKVELARRAREQYPPDPRAPSGVPQVIRTGRAELYEEIPDALLARAARDEEHLRLLREAGMRSVMIVPIRAREKVLGALSFIAAESGRRYTAVDLEMAEQLASHAGLAIENARLYEAERQARAEAERATELTRRLLRVSERLSNATGSQEIAQATVHEGSEAVGAFTAAVWVLDPAGAQLQMLHARGYPEGRYGSFPLSANIPLAEAVRQGVPIFLGSWEEYAARYPDSEALTRDSRQRGRQAIACLPLFINGVPRGAIALAFQEQRRFDERERGFLEILARHCGQALERVQLLEQERATSALRERLLAIVGHDLRNPLTAIYLSAISLLHQGLPEPALKIARRITSSAERMQRMIAQLLDFAKAREGRLGIEPHPANLREICERVLDELESAYPETSLQLRVEGNTSGVWDADRLAQVVSNLASNAIQHGQPGAAVSLHLDGTGSEVSLQVQNQGRPIPPEELPRLFDPFRRVDAGAERPERRKGLGLGLFIVHELVQAHRGTIEVSSLEQEGTVFVVRLPRGR
jgi:signal transduction histidine kinase